MLIAHTVITGWENMRQAGWIDYPPGDVGLGDDSCLDSIDSDHLAEFGGRLCYQSWERPNPDTATNDGYLANIIKQQHFSVLEHASATFYLDGISRSLTHELVRHRHLSFSQVSQRYVDESKAKLIVPPALHGGPSRTELQENLAQLMAEAQSHYSTIVRALESTGVPRKVARQTARAVLPNMTETKILVTGNMRAWRDVIAKRNTPFADGEIHALAAELLRQLKELAPNTFQDME